METPPAVLRALRSELTNIYDKHHRIDNELVVKEATDPGHPLHDRFEWDNTVAGHKYRLVQASQMLRIVKLDATPLHPENLRAFVAVKRSGSPRHDYLPTEKALMDPVARAVIVAQMYRDWETFTKRYQHMAEFADLIAGVATKAS